MDKLSFSIVFTYGLFSLFTFYLQLLSKNFGGSSQIIHLIITALGLIGTVFGIGYLIYFGWNFSWLGAGILFVVGILFGGLIGPQIEKLVGGATMLGMISVIGMPISAIVLIL